MAVMARHVDVPFEIAPEKIEQFKKACCSSADDWQTANRFLSQKSLKMNLNDVKADFEKSLVDTVRRLNTEEASKTLTIFFW